MPYAPLAHCAFISACFVVAASPVYAAGSITEPMIHEYYNRAASAFRLPFERYKAAQDEMLAPNYLSNAQITFIMPGAQPVQRTEKMTKGQSLQIAPQTHAAMKSATINYTVQNMKISPDGRTAQVTDSINVTGIGMQGLPMTMTTTGGCSETLALNEQDVLQVTSSNCTLKSTVLPKFR